ncbi:NAD(P)/FAD-dependent oxidoreductase [Clostridium ihumii]|uniref:NAD(P)/FAD-dependent oxidoreductase n=1 Tax=Clostridium ihumii TaxID=1470356 RepID=UPI003D32E1A6
MKMYDLIVIGGGISGMIAAITAKEYGAERVLVLEREFELGGALNYCVHNGFKSKYTSGDLTAPEYIYSLVEKLKECNIEYKTLANVISIDKDKKITAVSEEGILTFKSDAIIMAMGTRERPLGYKNILSHRCAGIVSAMSTLRLINKKATLPGKNVFILGSEDTAIFAARSLILEGANVKGIIETTDKIKAQSPKSKEFVEEFKLNVMTNSRVTKVFGEGRVTGVNISKLDKNKKVIEGSKQYMDCDTLVLSIYMKADSGVAEELGIIVDKYGKILVEEDMQTSITGIFSCGTIVSGYKTADKITEESEKAAIEAVKYLGTIKNEK